MDIIILKKIVKKIMKHVGYKITISDINKKYSSLPVELNKFECELIRIILRLNSNRFYLSIISA